MHLKVLYKKSVFHRAASTQSSGRGEQKTGTTDQEEEGMLHIERATLIDGAGGSDEKASLERHEPLSPLATDCDVTPQPLEHKDDEHASTTSYTTYPPSSTPSIAPPAYKPASHVLDGRSSTIVLRTMFKLWPAFDFDILPEWAFRRLARIRHQFCTSHRLHLECWMTRAEERLFLEVVDFRLGMAFDWWFGREVVRRRRRRHQKRQRVW
ncbi:hypothetical protein DFJ73DRAFT_862364 [Zopfochytrium polystomum]|nr:hypothetical protein DFJ73DRAFT_862364 [Zopfochytrium polystomum]